MAVNWTTAQAVAVIRKGEDKAAIQDIARRFPLFAVAAASGVEGLEEILSTLPEHQTARKIEAKLKEGLDGAEVAAVDEAEEAEEVPAKKAKKEKAAKGKKGKKAAEVEPEEDDEDEEVEEKPAKKAKGKKGKKVVEPEPEEDEDEDWEDEEDEDEDGDGLDEMSLAELKKEAKKRKVDIKGLKKPAQIVAALRADGDDEEDDEDEDDEDWDI